MSAALAVVIAKVKASAVRIFFIFHSLKNKQSLIAIKINFLKSLNQLLMLYFFYESFITIHSLTDIKFFYTTLLFDDKHKVR